VSEDRTGGEKEKKKKQRERKREDKYIACTINILRYFLVTEISTFAPQREYNRTNERTNELSILVWSVTLHFSAKRYKAFVFQVSRFVAQ